MIQLLTAIKFITTDFDKLNIDSICCRTDDTYETAVSQTMCIYNIDIPEFHRARKLDYGTI